jgi:hypothetical protein
MSVCRVSMMSLIVSEFDEIISAAGLSTGGDDRSRLVSARSWREPGFVLRFPRGQHQRGDL